MENASVVDRHSGWRVARDPVVVPPASASYHLKSDCTDRQRQQEFEKDHHARYRPSHRFRDTKVAPEMAPDVRSSPFYIPPFNGIGGGYSSKVAAVTSRMY